MFKDTGNPLYYTNAQVCFFAGLAEVFERVDLKPDDPNN